MLKPLKKTFTYQCRECDKPFTTQHKPTVCCSRACGATWGKRNADATRKANAMARNARVCEQCDKSFQKARNSQGRFCTHECRGVARRVYADVRERKRAAYARRVERDGPKPRRITYRDVLDLFGPPAKEVRVIAFRDCEDCGESFTPNTTRQIFCNAKCRRRNIRETRGTTALDRAMYFGVHFEYVNPYKVFSDANWHCQICGKATPIHLRGTYESNAPELDHIVPLSRNGPHTYANCQLACRKCNGAKSNKLPNE